MQTEEFSKRTFSNKVTDTNKQLQKLIKTIKDQKTLLNYISHEIKNPVHGILNISQLLYEHWNDLDDVERKEQVSNIANSSVYLQNLTINLLNFTDNANTVNDNFNLTNFITIVEDSINNAKKLYLSNNQIAKLKILCNDTAKEHMILADSIKIQQVLMNILHNAIKYTNKGDITIDIKNIMHDNKQYLQCDILDQGDGIQKEYINNLFEPFTNTNKIYYTSTGLGLFICKTIITNHDGEIWVDNYCDNDKSGAKFSFIIPNICKTK